MNNYVEPQPIEPYQAPVPQQPVEKAPRKTKGRSKLLFYFVFAILILGSALVIGYIAAYSSDNKTEDTNSKDSQTEDNSNNTITKPDSYTTDTKNSGQSDDTKVATDSTVTIDSPKQNAIVNGEINIEGTSLSNKKELEVRVYDFNKKLLGKKTVTNYVQVDDKYNWGETLFLSDGPSEKIGTLKVFEIVNLNTETLLATIPIKFQILEDVEQNHLKVLSPQTNQLVSQSDVLFLGSMANVFEATLNIRLTDELGNILYSGPLTATGSGDIYSGEFVEFNQTIKAESIQLPKTSKGKWEIFEISAKDGSEIPYLEIPVDFIE